MNDVVEQDNKLEYNFALNIICCLSRHIQFIFLVQSFIYKYRSIFFLRFDFLVVVDDSKLVNNCKTF